MYNPAMHRVWYPPYYPYQVNYSPLVTVGATTTPTDPNATPADGSLDWSATDALKRVTPTLLIVGIATGAAFAIGSGLVSRYLFREGRR